ncbi:MAG TPA: hypothetical protein VKT81_24945 [Bryobacteraceae bacterium]|nr:hypothetical protein [Bryobacteraceae bacterium]
MTFYLLSIAVVFLASAFGLVLYRLASRVDPEAGAAEWLESFSLESYAPMLRLLDQGDIEFLRKQPGFHPVMAKRLQAARRKVFVDYLWQMTGDFNQLLKIGRLILVSSKVDRPEFAHALGRHRNKFYWSVCVIRCKLALAPLGFRVGGPDLLTSFGSMLQQVRELASLETATY